MFSDMAVDLFRQHGKPESEYRVVKYPGAGHLLNVPYCPPTFVSLHPLTPKGTVIYMGGEEAVQQHHHAEEHSWEQTVQFFKEKLVGKK